MHDVGIPVPAEKPVITTLAGRLVQKHEFEVAIATVSVSGAGASPTGGVRDRRKGWASDLRPLQ